MRSRRATGCEAIYERSDAEVRALEGLRAAAAGSRAATARRKRCPIVEHGLHFRVDVEAGQKTGFFLDQRDNRQRVRALAAGREVLDAFCYTGGFTVAALAGGATHVTAVDSSAPALELAQGKSWLRMPWTRRRVEFAAGRRVRAPARCCATRARSFDLIVLDPPKFAPTAAHAENAARAYKDINLLALKLLRPGGLLATFSCSGGVSAELFQKIVAGAALDAGRGRADRRALRRRPPTIRCCCPFPKAIPEGAAARRA